MLRFLGTDQEDALYNAAAFLMLQNGNLHEILVGVGRFLSV